jgi:hypothetical protein
MTLGEKQRLFAKLVGQFITWAYSMGYEFTFGEALRTQAQASANAASGAGISNSNHLIKLAVDLNLFVGGVYQTDTQAYKALGEYWKTLHPLCRWGGDFRDKNGKPWPDSNHFSLEHQGVK